MKCKTLLVFALSLYVFSLKAQELPELLMKLKTAKGDSNIINTYIEIQNKYIETDPDSALYYLKKWEPLVKKNTNDLLNFKYHYEYTRILYYLEDYSQSIVQCKLAVNLAKKMKNDQLLGRSYRLLFNMYKYEHDYDNATYYALETLKIIERSNDTLFLAPTYATLSTLYIELELYEKGAYYGEKGIVLARKYKDNKSLMSCLNNAGNSYSNLFDYEKGNRYILESLKLAQKENKPNSIKLSYSFLCNNYQLTGDKENLDKYITEYGRFFQKEGSIFSSSDSANFYLYLAYSKLFNNKFQESENNLKKAINCQTDVTNYNLYNGFACLYYAWNKYDLAEEYFNKADSVRSEAAKYEVGKYGQELETKYKLSQKQNEILLKDIALQKSRNNMSWLLTGFCLLSILGSLGFYVFRKKQQTKALEAELTTQKLERQRIASEMHDELGGNLTSLMYLAHQLKMETPENIKINKVLDTSSDISSNINEIIWSLNQDRNSLKDWVIYTKGRLVEMLENSDQNYTFNIPENIPDRVLSDIQKRNLYLSVKEVVNNAIKHAKAEMISISLDFEKGLLITIADNGIGMGENFQPKPGSGNGIANIKQRVEAIGGYISWKNEDGTLVEIEID